MKQKNERIIQSFRHSITGESDLLGSETPSPLFPVIARLAANLMTCDLSKMLSKRSMSVRRLIHPIIMLLLPAFMEYKQIFESKNSLLGIDAPDTFAELPKEPVIWVANHGFKDDVAATLHVARHAYILFGSLPAFFNTLDGFSAYLNGVVMCNRKVKASKKASLKGAIKVLEMGTDMLIFPEGVWNKSPDKLILNLWPGIYHIAKETGCKIIPVIHYLANPHKKYKENVIHTLVGNPISMDALSEKEGLELIRNTMATWYYLMMERYGHTTREKLIEGFDSADEAWNSYIAMHTESIKYYDLEIELKADYRPNDIVRPENVYKSISEINNVSPINADHVAFAQQIVSSEKKRDFQRLY